MKVGDLVTSIHHDTQGVIVEAGSHPSAANGPAVRVKWFDGDDSIEWEKFLRLISEGR